MQKEHLEQAGYRHFTNRGSLQIEDPQGVACEALWQRKVEDDYGVRYGISIYEWHLDRVIKNFQGKSPQFQAKVHFHRTEGHGNTFEVSFDCTEKTVEEVEAFCDQIWSTLGLDYYERHSWVPSAKTGATNG